MHYDDSLKVVDLIHEGDPPPILVGSIQVREGGGVRRYAVRKGSVRSTHNSVISYADNIFYFKNVQFVSRKTKKHDL